MSSTLVYTSTRPTAASVMREVAARTAAARRQAEGLAAHDPLYGTWVCKCFCRRCIPSKSDCGGCVFGGCDLEFISHAAAVAYYDIYGVTYNRATGHLT